MSKKILIVTAHPSSKGITHRIADAFKSGAESAGHTVEILDLYKTDLKQDYLRYEELRQLPPDPAKIAIQQKITDAQEVVFVHPLWWMGPPAIMKNFIDQNFSARFAFRYIDGKRVGLLKGKSSAVFITCDGSIWLYRLMALPFWSIWRFAILNYCGLRVRAFKVLDRKLFRSEEYIAKFLEKVKKIGSKA